ncbi:MAG: OsmC family protein [Pseudomonadota bacterium]
MDSKHYAMCDWSPGEGFKSQTPYGEVKMFEGGGHRALELMLLSVAACLNYYLVEYVKDRKLPISRLHVECHAETVEHPERVSKITTKVVVQGSLSDRECKKMVTMCERACKVANTLKYQPKIEVLIERRDEMECTTSGKATTQF